MQVVMQLTKISYLVSAEHSWKLSSGLSVFTVSGWGGWRDGEEQRGDSEGSKPVWLVTGSVGLFDVHLFSWGFLWAHEGGQWDDEMLPPQELHGDIKKVLNIIIFRLFMQQSFVVNLCLTCLPPLFMLFFLQLPWLVEVLQQQVSYEYCIRQFKGMCAEWVHFYMTLLWDCLWGYFGTKAEL